MAGKDLTVLAIKRTLLPIFNEMRAREGARRRGKFVSQSDFLRFLLEVYKAVEGDTYVLNEAQKKSAS